jgi:hypothetical protein
MPTRFRDMVACLLAAHAACLHAWLRAGAGAYQDAGKQGKCVVLKTSTRQTVFLPVAGLVDPASLKPGDLVGVNKDSYLILDTLPAEYDSRCVWVVGGGGGGGGGRRRRGSGSAR